MNFKKYLKTKLFKRSFDKYKTFDYQKRVNPNNKSMLDYTKKFDKDGFVPLEIGQELERVCDLDNYYIGIHRTGFTDINEDTLKNFFQNGLINNGQTFQGASNRSIDLTDTVTFFKSFPILLEQITSARGYNYSQGVLLIKIPKEYLNGAKPIYFNDDGTPVLLSEFIYGFIKVENRVLTEIIRNPQYTDIHDYADDGLLYEGEEYSKFSKAV